jgi:hypothetical protein
MADGFRHLADQGFIPARRQRDGRRKAGRGRAISQAQMPGPKGILRSQAMRPIRDCDCWKVQPHDRLQIPERASRKQAGFLFEAKLGNEIQRLFSEILWVQGYFSYLYS